MLVTWSIENEQNKARYDDIQPVCGEGVPAGAMAVAWVWWDGGIQLWWLGHAVKGVAEVRRYYKDVHGAEGLVVRMSGVPVDFCQPGG